MEGWQPASLSPLGPEAEEPSSLVMALPGCWAPLGLCLWSPRARFGCLVHKAFSIHMVPMSRDI